MSIQHILHHEGKALAASRDTTDEELEKALETAESCLQDWCRKSPGERAAIISNAAAILRALEDESCTAATLEMDALDDQARREVALTADVIDYYAKNSQSLLQPGGFANDTETVGFSLILGDQPDSFPYFQLARMTAPNLLAGSVMMVKHVGNIPLSALNFERLWLEAGAPVGIFTNLRVSPEQALQLLEDPRIRGASSGGLDAVDRINRTTLRESRRRPVRSALVCGGSPG